MSEENTVIDFGAIGDAAAEFDNLTDQNSGGGGFEKVIPDEGVTMLRLRSYLELGKQKPNNEKYKPSLKCILEFELHGKRHEIEYEDADGNKQTRPNTLSIWINRPMNGTGLSTKSNYAKLFNAMNKSGQYTHFSQMVGTASWLGEIYHKANPKDEKNPYVNLQDSGKAWSFRAPAIDDPITGVTTPVAVPELSGDKRVFLWENQGLTDAQYQSLWDSIYIEGEHDAEEGKPAKSKNWMQNIVFEALDFEGSRLQRLIAGEGTDQLEEVIEATEEPQAAPEPEKKAEPKPAPAPKEEAGTEPPVEPETVPVEDPLAAMGLI